MGSRTSLAGEQKQWHRITLSFAGPATSEAAAVNPFRDYRLNVTLKHAASGRSLVVPGYFAADGKAANSGANDGAVWRAHFAPDAAETWTCVASFRTGPDVAIATSSAAGTSTAFNGENGSFTVNGTDKTGADFRAKGRLREVGQHYLQHMGTKEYFVKVGAGSPENLLAYADFDNTAAGKKPVHHFAKHANDHRREIPLGEMAEGRG